VVVYARNKTEEELKRKIFAGVVYMLELTSLDFLATIENWAGGVPSSDLQMHLIHTC
jgi:hypothetical protein